MAKFKDITGQRFGRLVAIKYLGNRYWLCACDCTNTKSIRGNRLRNGTTKSCGCICKETPNSRTHGYTGTRTFNIWQAMKARCTNSNHTHYESYGGRGIEICKRWSKFENFLADMGEADKNMTLERINNDVGYNKTNCKWATRLHQANNRRSNKYIEHNGVRKTYAQWSRHLGGCARLVQSRLSKGWSEERAVTTPAKRAAH